MTTERPRPAMRSPLEGDFLTGPEVGEALPAFTLTDASMIMPEAFRERVKETRPLKKHIYPEDVAGAIAFLAGDEASMLTGSHILITGGSHLQM